MHKAAQLTVVPPLPTLLPPGDAAVSGRSSSPSVVWDALSASPLSPHRISKGKVTDAPPTEGAELSACMATGYHSSAAASHCSKREPSLGSPLLIVLSLLVLATAGCVLPSRTSVAKLCPLFALGHCTESGQRERAREPQARGQSGND